MKTFVLTAGICLAASIAGVAHAYTSVSSSKIDKLTAFTAENSNASQLIVYLDTAPTCGTKTGFALKTAGSANQTAAALLNAAFLNDRGVSLEIDPTVQINGRCIIVTVALN